MLVFELIILTVVKGMLVFVLVIVILLLRRLVIVFLIIKIVLLLVLLIRHIFHLFSQIVSAKRALVCKSKTESERSRFLKIFEIFNLIWPLPKTL